METFPSAGEGEPQETHEAGELRVFGKLTHHSQGPSLSL